jgi:hypothetical protein
MEEYKGDDGMAKRNRRKDDKERKEGSKRNEGRHVGEVFMRMLDSITICFHGSCKLSTTKNLTKENYKN